VIGYWARRRLREELPSGPRRAASAAFGLTVVGAIGFAVSYVVDASVQWQGICLAVALAGLAVGFAFWADLMPPGPFVEERAQMEPPAEERAALRTDNDESTAPLMATPMPRRMLTLALSSLGLVGLFPLRSLVASGVDPITALATTPWQSGRRVVDEEGRPIVIADLVTGTALTGYPEGHLHEADAAVMVVRVRPVELQLPSDRASWSVEGVVAYSKICTHAGCPVGLYVTGAAELMCPCHQSVFDVLRAAQPRYGPAARPLPQLPIADAGDGTLVATGRLSGPVGPGYWRQS
jgi:ubiquinol-cytochrome c reductase iron-sulfur subunit